MPWDLRFSLALNRLTGGDRNQRFCSRVFQRSLWSPFWDIVRKVIDFWHPEYDHCFQAHLRHLREGRR